MGRRLTNSRQGISLGYKVGDGSQVRIAPD